MTEVAHSHISRQLQNSTSPIFRTGLFERKKLVPTEDGRLKYAPDPVPAPPPASPSPPPSRPLPQGIIWQAADIPEGSPGCEHFYLTEEQRDRAKAFRSRRPIGPAGGVGGGTPLVHSYKTHRSDHQPHFRVPLGAPETYFQVYHQDVHVCRPGYPIQPVKPDEPGIRAAIYEFSDKSRGNLNHICRNSGHLIRSQYCLTYHNSWPVNGIEAKRHLDNFLKCLRRYLPGVSYLWVLEFQKSNAPHFHVFLSEPRSIELGAKLARAWVRITKGTEEQYNHHAGPWNFMDWKMTNGDYVMKQYCSKASQKDVPDHYMSVGRFWGCSRGFQPVPEIVTSKQIAASITSSNNPWDQYSITRYFQRCLRRYHENILNYENGKRRRTKDGKIQPWKSSCLVKSFDSRPLEGSFRVPRGTAILRQLMVYASNNGPDIYSLRVSIANNAPF